MTESKWKDSEVDLSGLEYTEELFAGLPSRDFLLAQSKDERFIVGVWEAVKGVSEYTQDVEEFGHVLSGSATIEVEGEPPMEVGPGDIFFIAKGKKVKWIVEDSIRKVYTILV